MNEQRQEVQFEPTYSSSPTIRGVVLRICRKQWVIGRGGEIRSRISVLIARHHDDNDDMLIYIYIYIYIFVYFQMVVVGPKKE